MSPNSRSGRIRRVIILASLQSPQFSPFEELIAAQARSVRSAQAHARRSESAVWSPLLRLLFDDVLTASAAMEWISCGICQLMLHLQKLCLQRAVVSGKADLHSAHLERLSPAGHATSATQ